MRKLLCLPFFFFPLFLLAQDCTDPLVQPDPYAHCGPDYNPVCACDGNTYRNDCAAEHWGAILPGKYVSGPCSDFDFDLNPNPLGNVIGNLYIYMKGAGSPSLQIYNSMGILVFEKTFNNGSTVPGKISQANPYSLDMRAFQNGIYLVIVQVGGDKKEKKVLCLVN